MAVVLVTVHSKIDPSSVAVYVVSLHIETFLCVYNIITRFSHVFFCVPFFIFREKTCVADSDSHARNLCFCAAIKGYVRGNLSLYSSFIRLYLVVAIICLHFLWHYTTNNTAGLQVTIIE